MTADDFLAYMASKPKKERPILAKKDSFMLKAWLILRNDKFFLEDVICRHGLRTCDKIDENKHDHAIGNAWSHIVRVLLK